MFMKIYKHNASTWGITLNDYNQKGTIIWGNTEGDFYDSLSENIRIKNTIDVEPIRDTTDPLYDPVKVKEFDDKVQNLFNSKIQELINGVERNKNMINSHIDFDWLLPHTKEHLRNAIYFALQEALQGQWRETREASGFNTRQLSINNNLSAWVLSSQQFNTNSWNELQNSKIDNYKIVGGEDEFRSFQSSLNKDTLILASWNDELLISSKGEFDTLDLAIAGITTIDRFDYVVIKNKGIYRFEGKDFNNKDNWALKGEIYV